MISVVLLFPVMVDSRTLPEEWKVIPNTEGYYAASTWGRIKRLIQGHGDTGRPLKRPRLTSRKPYVRKTNKGEGGIVKPMPQGKGYVKVTLSFRGQRIQKLVHVLVATTWISDTPSSRHEVNHKNGVRTECQLSNLEWVTKGENVTHAYHVLKRKPAAGTREHAITPEEKEDIRRRFVAGEKQKDLSEEFGVTQSRISGIVRQGQEPIRKNLTDDQVREIRSRVAAGATPTAVGPDFGITRQQVTRICLRHSFTDVT